MRDMKKRKTITESQLRNIVAESVKNILVEGSKTNNKEDYFSRQTKTYDGPNGSYSIDYGPDLTIPHSTYAQADSKTKSDWKNQQLDDLRAQTNDMGYDIDYYDSFEDWEDGFPKEYRDTRFSDAGEKHSRRNFRKYCAPSYDSYNMATRIEAAKMGIPMKIAYRLSDATINDILKDLGVDRRIKPKYGKRPTDTWPKR